MVSSSLAASPSAWPVTSARAAKPRGIKAERV